MKVPPLRVLFMAAALFAATRPSVAEEWPRCTPLDAPVLRVEPPPTQYVDFCRREPGACRLSGPRILDGSDAMLARLARVNTEVNEEITLVSDPDNLGLEEYWDFPKDCRGDCEDFALEKRRRLVAEGVPSAALTIAFAFHEVQFFPHAVLLAETERGTWVLDNLNDPLMCWDALPYRYTRRERPDGLWTRFAPQ